MDKRDAEQKIMQEFGEFVDAEPAATSRGIDQAVLRMVAKDLQPTPWKVFAKLTLVEAAAGLVTLTICPQFGLGFGRHNEVLHTLHAATPPAVFYFLCGVLFVIFGAILGGLVLTRHEIGAVRQSRNRYFVGFGLMAYVVLVVLGPEIFMAVTLTWIVGAMAGNLLGFGVVVRMRQAGWRN